MRDRRVRPTSTSLHRFNRPGACQRRERGAPSDLSRTRDLMHPSTCRKVGRRGRHRWLGIPPKRRVLVTATLRPLQGGVDGRQRLPPPPDLDRCKAALCQRRSGLIFERRRHPLETNEGLVKGLAFVRKSPYPVGGLPRSGRKDATRAGLHKVRSPAGSIALSAANPCVVLTGEDSQCVCLVLVFGDSDTETDGREDHLQRFNHRTCDRPVEQDGRVVKFPRQ